MRVRICERSDIGPDTATRFDVDDLRVAIIRLGDDFYAIGDECSHADFSLSDGELEPDDCTIECPKHGAVFDVVTGEPETLPAVRPVPVYTVIIEDDVVYIERSDDDASPESESKDTTS